jgi:branched-chain amino acid transport system ATP-binding protein
MAEGLEVKGLVAGYASVEVVHGIDLVVRPGEVLGVLGRNGAGKSTAILAIAGFLGAVEGEVLLDGEPLTGPPHRRARNGVATVLEGRSVVASLTVAQQFHIARVDVDEAMHLFPELEPRLRTRAGMLSGGEQQMLALARAIGRKPRLLLIDELSFGLAPIMCDRVYGRLAEIAPDTTTLIVEQYVRHAATTVDRALVMNEGRVVAELTRQQLVDDMEQVEQIYLAGV